MEKDLVETRTGEIVPFDRGPIGIAEAKRRIEENQGNAQEILEEGVDWEKLPGISRPMLKKPAAEKLSRYAGVVGLPPVQANYEIIEREIDPFREWEFEKKIYEKGKFVGMQTVKTRGFYRYRVCCTLHVIGTEIAVGNKIGVCSSVDPGKETAMENTILQQAQIRANRQAVMAYIGISDRFTEEEAGDEIKRRKEAVGDTKGQPKGKPAAPSDESGFRMPFGKHKDDLIAEVPIPYLQWCLDKMDNLHDETRKIIEAEIKRDRKGNNKTEPAAEPEQKDDPLRESLLKEIPEFEAKLAELNDDFRPMKAREKSFGGTDITKSKDQDLIDYWTSLKSAIEVASGKE